MEWRNENKISVASTFQESIHAKNQLTVAYTKGKSLFGNPTNSDKINLRKLINWLAQIYMCEMINKKITK